MCVSSFYYISLVTFVSFTLWFIIQQQKRTDQTFFLYYTIFHHRNIHTTTFIYWKYLSKNSWSFLPFLCLMSRVFCHTGRFLNHTKYTHTKYSEVKTGSKKLWANPMNCIYLNNKYLNDEYFVVVVVIIQKFISCVWESKIKITHIKCRTDVFRPNNNNKRSLVNDFGMWLQSMGSLYFYKCGLCASNRLCVSNIWSNRRNNIYFDTVFFIYTHPFEGHPISIHSFHYWFWSDFMQN